MKLKELNKNELIFITKKLMKMQIGGAGAAAME